MMKGVMGQQNSCKTLIGVHEMHIYIYIYIYIYIHTLFRHLVVVLCKNLVH